MAKMAKQLKQRQIGYKKTFSQNATKKNNARPEMQLTGCYKLPNPDNRGNEQKLN